MSRIENLIAIWSMRPPPLSTQGKAWEDGARQGWEWAVAACVKELEEWTQAARNVGTHPECIRGYVNATEAVREIDNED